MQKIGNLNIYVESHKQTHAGTSVQNILILKKDGTPHKRPKRVQVRSSYLSPYKTNLLESKVGMYVCIRTSTIQGAGQGVFASVNMPKGFQIPYIGKMYVGSFNNASILIKSQNAYKKAPMSYILHDEDTRTVIDGHPSFNVTKHNVGFRINEPPKGTKPNTVFTISESWAKLFSPVSVRTIREIKENEELFVYYGDSYDRSFY